MLRSARCWRLRYTAPGARVANNPLFLRDVTPWPVNISWALFANRSSCFAGRELALALAPLPPPRREAINARVIRVFAGEGTTADVSDMAKQYGSRLSSSCRRTRPGTTTRSPRAPIIAWRKIATVAGGFMYGRSEDNDSASERSR